MQLILWVTEVCHLSCYFLYLFLVLVVNKGFVVVVEAYADNPDLQAYILSVFSSFQCVTIPGLGFRRGSYRCDCRIGFYFPDTTSSRKYFNGSVIEEEYEKKIMVSTFHFTNYFECLGKQISDVRKQFSYGKYSISTLRKLHFKAFGSN